MVSASWFVIRVAADEAVGASFAPSISAAGRFVVIESDATNLLGPGGDNNGARDIFVRDLFAQPAPVTFRISDPPGPEEPSGG